MNKSSVAVAVLLIGFVLFGPVWGRGLDEMNHKDNGNGLTKGPENLDQITLHYQNYEKDRIGPVGFSHKKHTMQYEVNCWECHHRYVDGKQNSWVPWGETEKCIDCHNPIKKQNGAMKLMTAFHLNCKVCHLDRDIYKGEIGAYKDCGKCHLRAVRIENQGYANDKMGPVLFQHRNHENRYTGTDGKGIFCADCHHNYVNDINTWTEVDNVKNCGAQECHPPETAKGERPYKLRFAYHNKCKGCHKALVTAGIVQNAPYKKCSSCHRALK